MSNKAKAGIKDIPTTPVGTKTCPKCSRSYTGDQFLSDKGNKLLKLCFPCRNASRICHRTKRERDAATKKSKKQPVKKPRIEDPSASTGPALTPALAHTFVAPAPTTPALASAAAAAATPASEGYLPSSTSDTSPGRILTQSLFNAVSQHAVDQAGPMSSFTEPAASIPTFDTPAASKRMAAASARAHATPFLNAEDTHENLLAQFTSRPHPKADVCGGDGEGDVQGYAQEYDAHFASSSSHEIQRALERMTAKAEEALRASPAGSDWPSTQAFSEQSEHLDLGCSGDEDDAERLHVFVVCKFYRYYTRK
ncbi:hypothetical protein BDW62DRAFT_198610 [Aspergillus aurantiobrunneus]